MKYEWRKQEKQLYLPKAKPEIVDVPKFNYLMISGVGNPNSQEFSDKIEVLYSLAYAIRMMPKSGFTPDGYFEYTVFPLEGFWDLSEEGKKAKEFNKDELVYTIMIRQPEFVTKDLISKAFESVRKKKNHPYLDDVTFECVDEGLSVQMMHIGPYDNEPVSFEIMQNFIKENNLKLKTLRHKEIYVSDPRRSDPSKLKTVLRYMVSK